MLPTWHRDVLNKYALAWSSWFLIFQLDCISSCRIVCLIQMLSFYSLVYKFAAFGATVCTVTNWACMCKLRLGNHWGRICLLLVSLQGPLWGNAHDNHKRSWVSISQYTQKVPGFWQTWASQQDADRGIPAASCWTPKSILFLMASNKWTSICKIGWAV